MRYYLLGLLSLAASIAYIQRTAISIALPSFEAQLCLSKRELGTVMAAWSFGYAAMQLPSGWLSDRWGTRNALTLYAILWSLATGLVALAEGFWSLLALWTLMGMAQAGIFPCAAKAIGRWFPDTQRATASGLLGAAMVLGGALAPLLTAAILAYLPWPVVFWLYALPGLLWAVLYRATLGEAPVTATTVTPVLPPLDWRRVWTSLPLGLLCAQQFLRAAAMVFFVTWFPTYLQEARGATLVQSGVLTTYAGLGAFLGGVLGGFVSDGLLRWTGRRRLSRQGIAVVGMSGCAALIVAAWFVASAQTAVLLIAAGAFSGTLGGVSGYTVAIEFGGKRVATVFSLMNMSGNIGAGLFPLAVAWLVEGTGNWDFVLFLFAAIFAVDAVCWLLLNPQGTLFAEGVQP